MCDFEGILASNHRAVENELARWLGNSPTIADAHYLMAIEAEFERAARDGALHNPVQLTETNRVEPMHTDTGNLAKTLEIARNAKKFPEACKSQGDAEHPVETQEKKQHGDGALHNPVHSGINFSPLSSGDLLSRTIRAHLQGDIE